MDMLSNRAKSLIRTCRVKGTFSELGIPTIVIGETQEVNL
jgi:hypothetical protein